MAALLFAACVLGAYQTVNYDIGNISSLVTALDSDTKAVTSGVAGLTAALQVEVGAVTLYESLPASAMPRRPKRLVLPARRPSD